MLLARGIPARGTFALASRTVALSFFICAAAHAGTETPRIPLSFAENVGQAAREVRYTGTGPGIRAWFEDRGTILQQGEAAIRTNFVGGAVPRIVAEEPLGAHANYLRGSDPNKWQTGVELYSAIRYRGVWPGVEIRYRAEQDSMKADYFVAPGASAGRIRLRFDGRTEIAADGSLRVHGRSGEMVEEKPLVYQEFDGDRRTVEGAFERFADGSVGFRVGPHDDSRELVIDPVILFSGFFGGSSQDSITAVAVDYYRDIVVAGYSSSTDLPTSGAVQPKPGGGVDAFVASFTYTGQLRYCTYLGGSFDDRAFGLALDGAQNVYITGQTSSTNFPLVSPLQTKLSGSRDAFVAKLSYSGSTLLYSTYLGGTGVDVGNAIAVDSAGEAVVFADTTSTNLAATAGACQSKPGGAQDTFVAKLKPAGNALAFLTYLGGSGIEHSAAVKIDGGGNILLGGYTWSTNFPVAAAWQAHSGGGQDGFVTKLSPTGGNLLFSTYLGGSGGSAGEPEEVNALAIDQLGNVIVGGTTSSANFPVTLGAVQTLLGGQTDGFLTRFNGNGLLLNSTYVGGALGDAIAAVAVDFRGDVYATGTTASLDFPVIRALQPASAGQIDAFVVKTTPTFSSLVWSTYLGGSGSDAGQAIAVDGLTNVVVAGQTGSPDYEVAGTTSLGSGLPSVLSAFVTKITTSWHMLIGWPVNGSLLFLGDSYRNSTSAFAAFFGEAADLPVVGDWDGTGVSRIGVFRNGSWYLDIENKGYIDSTTKIVNFGQAGDIPVVGDWTGTGRLALGLFRAGSFILDLSGHLTGVPTGQNDASFVFGQAGDVPIVADWNGSGTTKVGIFRNGLWLVDFTGTRTYGTARAFNYGQAGDVPLTGDWDGSGLAKIGVFREGAWILDYDGDYTWTIPYLNEMVVAFGPGNSEPIIVSPSPATAQAGLARPAGHRVP